MNLHVNLFVFLPRCLVCSDENTERAVDADASAMQEKIRGVVARLAQGGVGHAHAHAHAHPHGPGRSGRGHGAGLKSAQDTRERERKQKMQELRAATIQRVNSKVNEQRTLELYDW